MRSGIYRNMCDMTADQMKSITLHFPAAVFGCNYEQSDAFLYSSRRPLLHDAALLLPCHNSLFLVTH